VEIAMESPRPPDRLRRRLLLAGAALPAACAQVPLLPPPATPPPPPRVSVGQRWRYETIDLFRRARVGELSAEVVRNGSEASNGALPAGMPRPPGYAAPLIVALTDERGAPIGEEQWARPWDVIVDLSYDMPQIFEAPMPLLPDRLEPGARRNDVTFYRVPNASGRFWWDQRLRAIGWERVEVPAGRFDALRVERFINFQHSDTWREHPFRVDTLWYAPEVGRWVQREWTGRYRWPGGRRPVEADEDRVRWRLLEWRNAG